MTTPLRSAAAAFALLAWLAPAGAQELECVIQPRVIVELASPVPGVIEKVNVDRGDLITQGQVLVELQSSVQRAAVAVARARAEAEAGVARGRVRMDFADRELVRNVDLHEKNVVSESELDEARSTKELAEVGIVEAAENKELSRLEFDEARAALGQRKIRSPVDGVVVKRNGSPGEYADEDAILELADLDPLYVEVFAPVTLLGQIRKGMSALVMPEAPVGGEHRATVTVVDPLVDAASATFGVRLELPNPDHELPAGLNCRVRFLHPEKLTKSDSQKSDPVRAR